MARGASRGEYSYHGTRSPPNATGYSSFVARPRKRRAPAQHRGYGSKPNTPTLFVVPTNTLPFATVGVMNLFPLPN